MPLVMNTQSRGRLDCIRQAEHYLCPEAVGVQAELALQMKAQLAVGMKAEMALQAQGQLAVGMKAQLALQAQAQLAHQASFCAQTAPQTA